MDTHAIDKAEEYMDDNFFVHCMRRFSLRTTQESVSKRRIQ